VKRGTKIGKAAQAVRERLVEEVERLGGVLGGLNSGNSRPCEAGE
jgi:hypothetical protein